MNGAQKAQACHITLSVCPVQMQDAMAMHLLEYIPENSTDPTQADAAEMAIASMQLVVSQC